MPLRYIWIAMIKGKPVRGEGQDLRTLPTYTIPEAASFLAMPPRTLQSWYSGKGEIRLLVPSKSVGSVALLSFRDLEEAYKLYLLRSRYGFSFQELTKALNAAREASGSDHPLIDTEMSVFRSSLVMDLPARGRRREQSMDLLRFKQLTVRQVVDTWGKRVGSGKVIFPWRRFIEDEESRPVAIDPEVMSGRLVLTGTRIPVKSLAQRSVAGASIAHLADDYGVSQNLVEKALIHIGLHKEAA